jgi:glycosyltransferase involved in cell wall biosynthesis
LGIEYNLSYIIATRNRLPFLKITLEKLISELQSYEEIVVVDGNSSDGAKEYLQKLFDEGKIHQFISEQDKNQGHGWNKAMLMAKGVVVKKIIDDDVFCYEAIRKCRDYMLQNPEIEIIISNDLGSQIHNQHIIEKYTKLPQFKKWREGKVRSFVFGDVHMLIRRDALSYIGLYNTAYVNIDWEYSLRISYLKANIAYYTGYNALSISHPGTITSLRNTKLITDQGNKGKVFYDYPGDNAEISIWSKIKISIGKLIYSIKRHPNKGEHKVIDDMSKIYDHYYKSISEINKAGTFTFLKSN